MSERDTGIAVWLRPEQGSVLRAALARAGRVAALAGSPVKGRSAEAAAALGAEPADDLRVLLRDAPIGTLILADTGDLGGRGEDAADLARAAERGVRVVALAPCPASLWDLATLERGAPAGIEWLPRLIAPASPALDLGLTEDLRESFGPPWAARLALLGPAAALGTGARLLAGLAALHALFGEPERIDAAGAAGSGAAHALPGDTLRGLSGRVSANLRYAGGRSATLLVSDEVPREHASLTLVGPAGLARIDDGIVHWDAPDGSEVDAGGGSPLPRDPVVRLAEGLQHAWGDRARDRLDLAALLATAGAALLSARTGQGESPETIRLMARS